MQSKMTQPLLPRPNSPLETCTILMKSKCMLPHVTEIFQVVFHTTLVYKTVIITVIYNTIIARQN